ncbi:MAG: RNA polymerase-associated protein RapA [Gammaproteobacteria bacterium]|nr:MAG: RNA polymerase-associated protein RapA [Gammaproteobacteria bacterium]
MYDFIPGQRCISNAELEMGLGTVMAVDERTVTIVFVATGDTRTYSRQTAPLSRVAFTIGDSIRRHDGTEIVVTTTREEQGLIAYCGTDEKGNSIELPESELDNFIQLNRPTERLFNHQVDPDKWFELRYQTLQQQNRLAHSDLFGLTGCRTNLIPHQLYIAHEVANRYAPRVLLADEVGLGKTIEAGLILHHQLLTGRARRVLIVVPETLVHQWLVEMLRRFNLHFRIFDEERCYVAADERMSENLFHSEQLALCSVEFLMQNPDVHEQAVAGEWDLLVVDEAHHLAWSPDHASDEYRMIEQLARETRGVLLLTATPEQLGKESHFARLRLLDPDRFPDFEQFLEEEKHYRPLAQTIEDLINDKALTEADQELIRSTFNEGDNQSLLAQLEAAGKKDHTGTEARAELVEHLLDRHGTGRVLYRNTRSAIKGFPKRIVRPAPLPLPEIYRNNDDDDVNDNSHIAARLSPELSLINSSGKANWTENDPRIDWLVKALEKLQPARVLLIAASRDTVLDIAQHLKRHSGIHAAVFHEGLSIVERDRAAAYFADGETGSQLLLCSEIGSEGRNFQFAHHLILFDLPLNPDLLEQRIGRLDRIGQTNTIHIHVPYLQDSAQSVLFHWYHESLNAFEQTCPAGHAVFVLVEDELMKALCQPDKKTANLLKNTKKLYRELTANLHAGRDRLLEYNSCRQNLAEELKQRAEQADQNDPLAGYMSRVFDSLSIDSEIHSENCLIIHPTDEMVNQLPGLPDDGMTITFNRQTALSFEDAQYLTWEHPLVRTAMEMITSSEMGNTAMTAISKTHIISGSTLLECIYSLEVPPISVLQTDRYLPPTSIRVLIDERGKDHQQDLTHSFIEEHRVHVPGKMANKIIRAKGQELRHLFTLCENIAERQTPDILRQAHQQSGEILMREINRLKALKQINPNIRNEEIEFFEQQLAALNEVLDAASLRLDSLRVLISL